MTTEQVASEAGGGNSEAGGGNQPLAVARILDLCDRILEELGRRRHLFAWLRAPNAGPEEWLQVDAYYPTNRLVVVWHEQPGPHDAVYSDLVPARGLRLLELAPSDLAGDANGAELALRRRIEALGPAPRRASEPQPEQRGGPRPAFSLAPAAEVLPQPAAGQAQPAHAERAGLLLGFALAAILLFEIYVGVIGAGLDGGHFVLAFGLALDVCARGLGTIAAGRAGEPDWAWWCALGGSPVVASFAVFGRRGPVTAEPAPLAGLLSLLALAALAIALLAAVL